ncbi:hypothetical protein H8E88_06990 [candidate division KSB1 bacterium]|nr:hypothetical protein [candidate division KSB1 bacterium]
MPRLSKKYRRIYRRLTNFELQATTPGEKLISADDIFGDLTEKERPHLFLNFYSEQGIKNGLEEYGIFDSLRKQGFKDFIIKVNARDPYRHALKIYFEKEKNNHLLGELHVRKKNSVARPVFSSEIEGHRFTLVFIEWLTLQNPTATFTTNRPPLPGQKYPGLKIGREVLGVLINMTKRLKTDGLLNIPDHYHNAVFYSRSFKFFDPHSQGLFLALKRDLKNYDIGQAAWSVELECVIEKKSGKNWKWFTQEQILPVSKKMQNYFTSENYLRQVNDAKEKYKYEIDIQKFNELISKQSAAKIVELVKKN